MTTKTDITRDQVLAEAKDRKIRRVNYRYHLGRGGGPDVTELVLEMAEESPALLALDYHGNVAVTGIGLTRLHTITRAARDALASPFQAAVP